ncbi:MAG TPA: glucose-6-phosphate dehydrogenase assembly protein OpcA [Pyrinomonadaceae bacterium]|jgi:glucose-6-phosphate dehydrogenase assembly protein OpcA|nr:glucose-6-phosphate dehydrogenase assembly protein OpcA [Pyrinomonadaceae bacterium]
MNTQESTSHLSVERGVDASKVERELTAMWAEMSAPGGGASSEGAAQSAGVVRACVLNLVVYAAGREERAEADELLETVVERHPCRAIVIAAERGAGEARLDAYASTRCQVSARGSKRICGEQITVEAAGAAVETVSTAVAPLLVPDVPVFLWWKDIPGEEDKLFQRLSATADRVVIDSSSFDHPHEDMLRLAQIISGGALRLSDLNWGRLTSWRSLVASFWDVDDYRDSLARVERVRIEYDPPDHAHDSVAPKALLALGWIASCLGWDVAEGGHALKGCGARFRLRDREGRAVEAVLSATDDVAGRDGWITSLSISTAAGDEFYVVLRMNEGRLETGVRRGGREADVGRVLAYEARTEGQRLSAELEILSRDRVYEASVALAARMLAAAAA